MKGTGSCTRKSRPACRGAGIIGSDPPPRGEMDHKAIEENHGPGPLPSGKPVGSETEPRSRSTTSTVRSASQHLEAVEGLRAGLKGLSSGADPARSGRSGAVVSLRDPRSAVLLRPAVLLAAACLAVAALVPTLFLGRYRRTIGELSVARSAVAQARKESASLADALERERRTKTDLPAPEVSVFTLDRTRGCGADRPDSPARRILVDGPPLRQARRAARRAPPRETRDSGRPRGREPDSPRATPPATCSPWRFPRRFSTKARTS